MALLVLLALPAQAEDFWGRMLPDQPADFIFGYGSLINTASRNAALARPVPVLPVRVSAAFGYVRAWNDRAPSGFTALGLRHARPDETPATINGVLYPAVGTDMATLDRREQGYVRVEVPHADIAAASWQAVPATGRIWTYVPAIPGQSPGEGLPIPNAKFPLLQSYIDVVVEGGLEYGADFAREIILTTRDWSAYWLNDRELPRRPWVFDPKSAQVDKLLAAAAPHFADRRLPAEFAAKYLMEPAGAR